MPKSFKIPSVLWALSKLVRNFCRGKNTNCPVHSLFQFRGKCLGWWRQRKGSMKDNQEWIEENVRYHVPQYLEWDSIMILRPWCVVLSNDGANLYPRVVPENFKVKNVTSHPIFCQDELFFSGPISSFNTIWEPGLGRFIGFYLATTLSSTTTTTTRIYWGDHREYQLGEKRN